MYRPAAFAVEDRAELLGLVAAIGVAHVVTVGATPSALTASVVPLVRDPEAPADRPVLLGHLARANPQWQAAVAAPIPALAVVAGPSAYVSPSAYPSKREHGRVVPTWNHVTVHVHGALHVHDDPAFTERVVRLLTDRHEGNRAEPWSVDDAPADFVAAMVRAVVGVALHVEGVEGVRKLSQNRPAADAAGVAHLLAEGSWADRAVAREMGHPG